MRRLANRPPEILPHCQISRRLVVNRGPSAREWTPHMTCKKKKRYRDDTGGFADFCSRNVHLGAEWRRNMRTILMAVVCLASFVLVSSQSGVGQTNLPFPPISKEELQLKDNPAHPGDPAIILYHEIDTDSSKSTETHFVRIKIFTEAGKKYGDVEIPYLGSRYKIENIQARSVDPEGHSAEFTGSIFDRILLRSRRLKVTAKSFSLPDVHQGTIIEYSYRLHWHKGVPDPFKNPNEYIIDGTYAYPAAEWQVQQDLFVRRSHFVLLPCSRNATVAIRSLNLPDGIAATQHADGSVTLDIENVLPIPEEEYSPPENSLATRVLLFYVVRFYSNEGYWIDEARREYQEIRKFLAPSRVVKEEAARLAPPNSDPEERLRKLYERVQKIRYVSFERERSETERQKEDLKPNKNVEQVLTRGYGFGDEINLLFLALAREAGFIAYPVRVTARDQAFFLVNVPDPEQLNAAVIEVKLKGKSFYFDPATLYCPFGLLPWDESGAEGIRLDDVFPELVRTAEFAAHVSLVERRAELKLDNTGTLKGKLRVIFYLQEALNRRLKALDFDEAGRRRDLEEEVKTWLPKDAMVTMISSNGWDRSDGVLETEFELQIPSFGARTGQRQLFPISIFESSWKDAFRTAQRETPVYLEHAYRVNDDLVLDFGDGYKLATLPASRSAQERFGAYELSAENSGNTIHVKRVLVVSSYYVKAALYPDLKSFCDFTKMQDEEQVILEVRKKAAD